MRLLVKVPRMYRSLFTRLLLIFALLLAQMGGLAHGISHILAEKSQGPDQSLPHDKYCGQCAAYAQIGGLIAAAASASPAARILRRCILEIPLPTPPSRSLHSRRAPRLTPFKLFKLLALQAGFCHAFKE